jgi:hypothetical protein
MSPGSPSLFFPRSSDCTSPSINLRRVEGGAQLACSRVADEERLLRDTLASVHRSILCPVQVSLRRGLHFCANCFFFVYLYFLIPCSHSSCPRIEWMLQPCGWRLPRSMRPLVPRSSSPPRVLPGKPSWGGMVQPSASRMRRTKLL